MATHQNQMSSGLLRYRSAPSSLFGEVCESFLPVRPSSPETESMFARFLSPELEIHNKAPPTPAGSAAEQRSSQFPPPHPPPAPQPQQAMYQHQSHPMVTSSVAMDADPIKNGGGHCSNIIRQSSSPAGLFANLNVDSGYGGVMRGIGGFRNGNDRLKGQLSFSSRQSSLMSQISENEPIEDYQIGSWEESPILSDNTFSNVKRPRDAQTEPQNGEVRNGLSHQFSLPKTSSEMAAIEKFLQFQDSVPCKIRAKRGCATHPRSIAERVRRTRISERMRKLQELVPNMDKQTNTADMLDLAVDYIKDLQKEVKTLSESRAKCMCSSSSKQKPNTIPQV